MKLDLASGVDVEIKNLMIEIGLIEKIGMTREFLNWAICAGTVLKIEKVELYN